MIPLQTPVRVRNMVTAPVALRGLSGVVVGHVNPWQVSIVVQFADGTKEAFRPEELETL